MHAQPNKPLVTHDRHSDPPPLASTLLRGILSVLLASSVLGAPATAGSDEGDSFLQFAIPADELPGHEPGARRLEERPPEHAAAAPWWQGEHATGDWLGARSALVEAGIDVEGAYIFDGSYVLAGGLRQDDTGRGLLDVNVTFDLERLARLPGGTVFVDVYTQNGHNGSEDVGDIQGFSNIDSDDVSEIAELWYEQWLANDRLRVKIGKVEANAEFAFVEAAGDFLNSSGGFSPTIFVLPTYPDPAWGLHLFAYPTDHAYVGAAVYDGASATAENTGTHSPNWLFDEGRFWIAEAGRTWEGQGGRGGGRVAAGGWHHTADFERFDGGNEDGTWGLFALFEQQLWKERADLTDDQQGVSVFLQYGWADEEVSEIAQHLGAGLLWVGPLAGRDDDAVGAMVTFVDLSDAASADFAGDEMVAELFYRLQVTPFLSLKPDLQTIFNPSGAGSVSDAVVATLRIEVAL